jgi:hypothetical protein
MTHLTWGVLNDATDGTGLSSEANVHLQSCLTCRQTLARLRAQYDAARSLPAELPPPDDLWRSIQATISSAPAPARPVAAPVRWATRANLLAAAVALIALTATATTLVLRPAAAAGDSTRAGVVAAVVPAAWQATEEGYLATVEELREQLDGQRGVLAPETVATVERVLATIDAAIAEARDALLRDPANEALAELLASNYRQKIELLRRATQMAAT